MNRRNYVIIGVCLVVVLGLSPVLLSAQTPEREYVIGVGDQLNIQVFNQVQPLSNFSAGVSVRSSDRMITMPWLGDIRVAGLKKSTLTTQLESKEYLGKFLTDPHVTITPVSISANIMVIFSGVITVEQELPRDIKLGQVLRQLAPNIQQFAPNLDAITITSAEGEVFPSDQNLRLQWGDEISIPASAPTPTPIPQSTPIPVGVIQALAQFTEEEYQTFQIFMQEEYPEAYEELLPLVRYEDDMVFIDLVNLSDEQRARLPQAVFDELKKYPPKAVPPLQIDATLVGIRVNLNVKGFQEAFLAFPNPEGGSLIRRFIEGDVIRPGENGDEDLILVDVDEVNQQVLLEQGEFQQTLEMMSPFSSLSLVGMLKDIHGKPEAVLQSMMATTATDGPMQRKRYTEGDEVEPGVILARISEEQQLIVLQNEEAVQLLFLRDPQKRSVSQPSSASSPVAPPDPFADSPLEAPSSEQNLMNMLQQQMPEELQAIDTLSELFFATPLF